MKNWQLKKLLPQKIDWVSVDKVTSNSYQEVLVVTHKHTEKDWSIAFGWIEPNRDYTDFKVVIKPLGLSKHYPDIQISKRDILLIGLIHPNYGV